MFVTPLAKQIRTERDSFQKRRKPVMQYTCWLFTLHPGHSQTEPQASAELEADQQHGSTTFMAKSLSHRGCSEIAESSPALRFALQGGGDERGVVPPRVGHAAHHRRRQRLGGVGPRPGARPRGGAAGGPPPPPPPPLIMCVRCRRLYTPHAHSCRTPPSLCKRQPCACRTSAKMHL